MARKSPVPTEDIPSVTQLFTPHWIARYLVENSLGRLWLLNRPESRLREHMPYYIDGEGETDFLKIAKPEDIRVIDPAVGSGHMLTYAFDLLYAIYVEEGYAPADVPALILEHNLHGLDICPRAAQLAALALVLKAREKSRRFFQSDKLEQPRIIALQDVHFAEGELREYMRTLNHGDLFDEPMLRLLRQFEEATTFGSLIQPCLDEEALAFVRRAIESKDLGGQLFLRATHVKVLRVLAQSEALSRRYQVVIANPPYMTDGINASLGAYLEGHFGSSRSDLSATFIARALQIGAPGGLCALVTMHSWMFLSSLQEFREDLQRSATLLSLTHHGIGAFPTLGSKVVQTVAFVARLSPPANDHVPVCFRLLDYNPEVKEQQLLAQTNRFASLRQSDYSRISGSPFAFWLSESMVDVFSRGKRIGDMFPVRAGMSTGDSAQFVRFWHEVSFAMIGKGFGTRDAARQSGLKWFPFNKGGKFRKWFGNSDHVVDFQNDGEHIKMFKAAELAAGRITANNSKCWNQEFYFLESVSWTKVSTGSFCVRYSPPGTIASDASNGIFAGVSSLVVAGLLCSRIAEAMMSALNPTLNVQVGNVAGIPWLEGSIAAIASRAEDVCREAVALAKADWDAFETSWDFATLPLLERDTMATTLEESFLRWQRRCSDATRRMQELETENNRLFSTAYKLQDELVAEVSADKVTLASVDARKAVTSFLSYAVGCVMGRYSLDHPGLILANAGDTLTEFRARVGRPWDSLTFLPDGDGIVPVLDGERFGNEIVARTREFLRTTFGEAPLASNLLFIEEVLGKDLRKYFQSDFYKEHRQTYKGRPIYWLFSSGKQRAFQCLVYLHRYNEGTLSRMRTEYVVPLQGQIASRIEQLEGDKAKATSTSHRKKLQKEQDLLKKQQTELLIFDEKLKHAAGQKISLNLDDGVKVNYGKFGDLLADVDAVTGGADE
jgi:hypothetical protein